ncbi:MAG: conjugal transfer protein TraN [Gallionellaceae bacterium]|nr:conjugal transfer protein TraN [Gallionellaceae bacterium]
MNKLTIALLSMWLSESAFADAVSEARAVGQGSISAVSTGLQQPAQWTAPAVTASQGGVMPQSTAAGAAIDGTVLAAQCAANPGAYTECEAINAAAASMQPGSTYQSVASEYADVDKLRSGQLPLDAEAAGIGIGGAYNCTSKTVTKGSIRMYTTIRGRQYDCLAVDDRIGCCCQGRVLTHNNNSTGQFGWSTGDTGLSAWSCVGNSASSSSTWGQPTTSTPRASIPRWFSKTDPRIQVENNTWQETVTTCDSTPQTGTDTAWDPGNEPDNDLAAVVAYMEAGREAGVYMNPDTLEIFKGFASRCKKKLFGAVNCCKGASGSGSGFSNAAIGAMSMGGNAMASTYTYDALFASSAPDMVITGFSTMFGSGTSSSLAGMLAGDVSVEGFLTSLIPGPWTIAMLALQFSGLMDCSDSDKETAMRKDASLCVSLGSYCSKEIIFGACLERTQSYCCFNSVLAKLINTQGKAQLGKSMGSATRPNCSGFTPAELQRLDLSVMDLTEFMDQVKPKTGDPGATSCYFHGDTSCPAVH